MMWKKPVSKFKNASCDDFNRHPSYRLAYSADTVTSMTASLKDLVWAVEDGSVYTLPADLDPAHSARRLPAIPATQAVAFSPFLGDHCRLALLSSGSLHIGGELDNVDARSVISLNSGSSGTAGRRSRGHLAWNRSAEGIIAVAQGSHVTVADALAAETVWTSDVLRAHPLCVDWDPFGSQVAAILGDGTVEQCDSRAAGTKQILDSSLTGDCRLVWTSDQHHVLLSGADKMRERQLCLYDLRSSEKPVERFSCGRGHGCVELLYDYDTNMLFSFGKGDVSVCYTEVLCEGGDALSTRGKSMYNGNVGGATLAPRVGLDLMKCEVARLLVACGEKILQGRYHIPRKSYTEFYPDIYEACTVGEPSVTNAQWSNGTSYLAKRVQLTPAMQKRLLGGGESSKSDRDEKGDEEKNSTTPQPPIKETQPAPVATPQPSQPAPQRRQVLIDPGSKFKHIQGRLSHKREHLSLNRTLELRVPPECDMVSVNARYVAYQVVGAGTVEVLDRVQSGRVIHVESGSPLQSFMLDHLNERRLAVGSADGYVRIWIIPEEETLLRDPTLTLSGHAAKITHVMFHRSVNNLLLSAAFDGQILFWNLSNEESLLLGSLAADGKILALSWSPVGDSLAAVGEDGRVLVWMDARSSDQGSPSAVSEEPVTTAGRSARLAWFQDDVIATSGIQGSKRAICACRVTTAEDRVSIGVSDRCLMDTTSPAVLTICADVDKQLVLAVGRGDGKVRAFDVRGGSVVEAAFFSSEVQLQGLAIVSPVLCDVRRQQVASGFLLTQTSVQPIEFLVPRVKTDFFHDDLFPDCSYLPAGANAVSAERWWSKEASACPAARSLRPPELPLYSVFREEEEERRRLVATKFTPRTEAARQELTDQERQAQVVASMMKIIDSNAHQYGGSEQAEGVDSDEWEDD